jgi:hypothetical protein
MLRLLFQSTVGNCSVSARRFHSLPLPTFNMPLILVPFDQSMRLGQVSLVSPRLRSCLSTHISRAIIRTFNKYAWKML